MALLQVKQNKLDSAVAKLFVRNAKHYMCANCDFQFA